MKKFIISVFSALVASLFIACSSSTSSAFSTSSSLTPTTDATITIYMGDMIYDRLNGKNVFVEAGSFKFNVLEGRQVFLKKVHDVCYNPSQSIKQFLPNSRNRSFDFWVDNPSGEKMMIFEKILNCVYDEKGKLESIAGLVPTDAEDAYVVRTPTPSEFEEDYKGNRELLEVAYLTNKEKKLLRKLDSFINADEFVEIVANGNTNYTSYVGENSFNYKFFQLLDIAKAQMVAQGKNPMLPSKTTNLTFGIEMTDPKTGKYGIVKLYDLSVNVNEDRRQILKNIYRVCLNPPTEQMKNYIKVNLINKPHFAIYYKSKAGLKALELDCHYDNKGQLSHMASFYDIPKNSTQNGTNTSLIDDAINGALDKIFGGKTLQKTKMSDEDEFIEKMLDDENGKKISAYNIAADIVRMIETAYGRDATKVKPETFKTW